MYYNRKGEEISLEEWRNLFEDKEYKVIKQTRFDDGTLVSTIWLGLNHNFLQGVPIIFETMVFFKDGREEEQVRYSTEEETRFAEIRA